jgi:hypothetical protein
MLGPLWLDALIRPYWGSYNPLVLSQLDPLVDQDCYQMKFYRVPDPQDELLPAGGYIEFGLNVTPGSLLLGFLVPPDPTTGIPGDFTFQLEDLSTGHKVFNEAVPGALISNYHPTVLDPNLAQMASFWNLLDSPYPVVGSGLFRTQIQNTGSEQRIEVVIGALEVKQC